MLFRSKEYNCSRSRPSSFYTHSASGHAISLTEIPPFHRFLVNRAVVHQDTCRRNDQASLEETTVDNRSTAFIFQWSTYGNIGRSKMPCTSCLPALSRSQDLSGGVKAIDDAVDLARAGIGICRNCRDTHSSAVHANNSPSQVFRNRFTFGH